ncbi:hypothetical protein K438DRAFT_1794543 [Mycena galopus ATCC 62051]|nr:hypothetical protein K438DRAFT_1794543 [Mycena galopus ATCC 62051]
MSGDSDLFSLCSLHFAIYGPFAATAVESARRNRIFSKLSTRRQPPLTVSVDARLILLMVFLNSGGRIDRLGARPNGRDNAVERTKIGWTSIGKYLMQKSSSASGPIPPERVIHIELKRLGAWNGRTHCPYCSREHQGKFDLLKCGGKAGLVRIVEARLTALGWSWKRTSPSKSAFLKAFNAPPTPTDGVGGCYAYFANGVLKFGRSNRPLRHKAEWQRRCRGEDQDWMDFYWEIPYAKKFERVIHIELKRLGAWNGRTHCPYCGREHQEKFDLLKCGGKAGLVRIVEARLAALGWSWKRSALHSQLPRHTYTSQGLFLVF